MLVIRRDLVSALERASDRRLFEVCCGEGGWARSLQPPMEPTDPLRLARPLAHPTWSTSIFDVRRGQLFDVRPGRATGAGGDGSVP